MRLPVAINNLLCHMSRVYTEQTLLFLHAAAAAHLLEPEDHELRRLDRRDPDLDDQLAGVAHSWRVKLGVALDVEGLLGCCAKQRAAAPDARQERGDGSTHALPQVHIVRLKYHPLGALVDRFFQKVEQAP